MSTSEKFSGRMGGSNFGNTCNLLSRFIKKKGRRLRDFNIEIDGKIECLESIMKSGVNKSTLTRSMLTDIERSAQPSMIEAGANSSMNSAARNEAVLVEPKSDQLTIFYAGRVLVFDNCPADKAQELVNLAEKGCSGSASANVLPDITSYGGAAAVKSGKLSFLDVSGGERSRPSPLAGTDLPIARRASVHRFLEKRKERAAAAGAFPYENQACSSSSSDQQLDLNL